MWLTLDSVLNFTWIVLLNVDIYSVTKQGRLKESESGVLSAGVKAVLYSVTI